MKDIKQKFILTLNNFHIGRCIFHKELNRNSDDVIGGGSWFWDEQEDTLYLYGSSHDFGSVSKEDIENNITKIQKRYFRNSTVIFEENEYKTLLEILSEKMSSDRAKLLISRNDFL